MLKKDWKKVGETRVLAKKYGRSLLEKHFVHPEGQTIDYAVFSSDVVSVVVFPLTTEGEVVLVKQFRPGIEKTITELPSGNVDPKDKNLTNAVARELSEETGYVAQEIIQIPAGSKLWIDPAYSTPYVYSFVATGCRKLNATKQDKNEHIKTMTLPLATWMKMITSGKIIDMKSIAITLLADMFLKRRHNDGYQTK